MGFEEYNPQEASTPVNGDFGRRVAAVAGQLQDGELELLRAAVLARIPSRCPDDALDALGRTMRIERYHGESDAVYRARLQAAWPTWEIAGSAESIETQLSAAGHTGVRCYDNEELGGGYDYSMFAVSLEGFAELAWGAFTWGDPSVTWGSSATPDERDAIVRIVLKWKAAHGVPIKVILDLGGGIEPGVSDPEPCVWYLANVWGESMVWGESDWGTGRWYSDHFGFSL